MLKALDIHKNDFVSLVSDNSMNDNVSDAFIRLKATGIRNTEAIISLINNKEAMQKKIEKL